MPSNLAILIGLLLIALAIIFALWRLRSKNQLASTAQASKEVESTSTPSSGEALTNRGELTTSIVQFFLGLVKILFWIGIFLFFFWVLFIGDMDKKVDFLSENIPGLDRFVEPVVEWEYVDTYELSPKELIHTDLTIPLRGQCYTIDPSVKYRITVEGVYTLNFPIRELNGKITYQKQVSIVRAYGGLKFPHNTTLGKKDKTPMEIVYGDVVNVAKKHYGSIVTKITSPTNREFSWELPPSNPHEFHAREICFAFLLGALDIDRKSLNDEKVKVIFEKKVTPQ